MLRFPARIQAHRWRRNKAEIESNLEQFVLDFDDMAAGGDVDRHHEGSNVLSQPRLLNVEKCHEQVKRNTLTACPQAARNQQKRVLPHHRESANKISLKTKRKSGSMSSASSWLARTDLGTPSGLMMASIFCLSSYSIWAS